VVAWACKRVGGGRILRRHYKKIIQLKSNQIKSNQIKSNQIKSNQIKSNQTKSNQIKSNQIKSNQIKYSSTTALLNITDRPVFTFTVT
jgi:hypothetical protein